MGIEEANHITGGMFDPIIPARADPRRLCPGTENRCPGEIVGIVPAIEDNNNLGIRGGFPNPPDSEREEGFIPGDDHDRDRGNIGWRGNFPGSAVPAYNRR